MDQHSGQILTFYSYKGGTGRSMAVANFGCWLARKASPSARVLLIDWDLEAPGLHRYFPATDGGDTARSDGLIDYFCAIRDGLNVEANLHTKIAAAAELRESFPLSPYISRNVFPGVDLIRAGRLDTDYPQRVSSFNWIDFHSRHGDVFRSLREMIAADYSYCLIDSRTGFNDVSGICTMLMPEKLVLVFTPNRQSLSGVLDLAVRAVNYRRSADDFRPLAIFPLPSRIENAELELKQRWRKIYQSEFEAILTSVHQLDECELTQYFDDVLLPHVSFYSFGEEIAVLREKHSDALSLRRAYDSFFRRLETTEFAWDRLTDAAQPTEPKSGPPRVERVDVFISYAHIDNQPLLGEAHGWVDVFVATLEMRLNQLLGTTVRIWRDQKLSGNDDAVGIETTNQNVRDARCFVAILSPAYVHSPWCLAELKTFLEHTGLNSTHESRRHLFKVIRLPVEQVDQPEGLSDYVGFEFYRTDENGTPREFTPDTTEREMYRSFMSRLGDLAYYISNSLRTESTPQSRESSTNNIYVTESISSIGYVQNARVMDVEAFVRRLRAETNAGKRFALFLGAGCSVTSGIPTAGALVRDRWIPRLRDFEAPHRSDVDDWAKEVIQDHDLENPALSYGKLIDRLFLTPFDRQREIEDLCDGRTPSFGYAVLAQLIAQPEGRFNIVLTTNFDDLVADALYLYTAARPLVIHHESLAAFIRPTRTRPLIVKLHGDHRLSPRNTALETATLEQEIQRHTAMVLHDRGVIFMGYGGADTGILKMFNDLPPEALPYGAYWVHPQEPQGEVREWLERRGGVWVRSGWFDEVMLLIRNAFDLPHPSAERFDAVFRSYQQKFQELVTSIQQKPIGTPGMQALQKALADTEAHFPDYWKAVSEALRLERLDPDRAEEIYRQAVTQFPHAAPLLGNYALFLSVQRKDYVAAEAMFKRAINADPTDADSLGNYANFLSGRLKDYVAAEAMYKRAIEANLKHANNLGNYALFLENQRKDYHAAEAMYKRAIKAESKHANNLGNYAVFLENQQKDYDAAEAMYKRAIEADPKHANTLGNYALFLSDQRKDYVAAEAMYKRAIEADPKHANALSNYALFLKGKRKDYDAAEAMYRHAIEADPTNGNTRANLARLLLAAGKADGLTVLREALASMRVNLWPAVELECAFYLFAHGPALEQAEGLKNARRLLESSVRSPGWDRSRSVERSQQDGHPEAAWLGKLAAVINDEAQPEVLAEWPAWRAAAG